MTMQLNSFCRYMCLATTFFILTSVTAPSLSLSAERGFLGMQVQGISSRIAGALDLPEVAGVLVLDISLDGPASNAGIRRGDLIVTFDGIAVDTFERLVQTATKLKAGSEVKIDVLRRAQRLSVVMTLSDWPDGWKIDNASFAAQPELGITLAALTQTLRERMGIRWGSTGVVVTVSNDQFAGVTPLRRGDVVVQVNQQEIWDPKQFLEAYQAAKDANRPSLLILVERTDGFKYLLQPINYAGAGAADAPLFKIPGQGG